MKHRFIYINLYNVKDLNSFHFPMHLGYDEYKFRYLRDTADGTYEETEDDPISRDRAVMKVHYLMSCDLVNIIRQDENVITVYVR